MNAQMMNESAPNRNILNNNSLMFKTADLMYCMIISAYYISITSWITLVETINKTVRET